MAELRIAAVGDLMLNRPPGSDLPLEALQAAHLRLANLEGPITTGGIPADKIARLQQPLEAAQWIRQLGFDALSLANNHMMDWGAEGMQSTRQQLQQAGIAFAGAGNNLTEALQPAFLEAQGARVAMVSLSATVPPGAAAGHQRPGIAPLRVQVSYWAEGTINDEQPGTPPWVHTRVFAGDQEAALEVVRQARSQADIVLVQLHWGVPPEWNSPFQGDLAEYQRPLGYALVEAGASAIIGHHAHALLGMEFYRGVPILYSLGNFLLHFYSGLQGLKPQRPVPFFKPRYSEQNRQSVIAQLAFEPTPAGWQLQPLVLWPIRLNDQGEPSRVTAQGAAAILSTLQRSDASQAIEYLMQPDYSIVARPQQG